MITRTAKTVLVAAIALFYTLVVFNNLTDFNSNYQFVRHVLTMDSTFPGNHGMWRALPSPSFHLVFYISIIAWEAATMILLWWGAIRLVARDPAPRCPVQCCQECADDGVDALDADVAGSVSHRGSRVVFDVAIAYVEWAGTGLPHVRGGRAGAADHDAA